MAAKVAAAIRRAEKKLDATIATRSRAGGGHRRGARRRSGARAAVEAAGAPWTDIEVAPPTPAATRLPPRPPREKTAPSAERDARGER